MKKFKILILMLVPFFLISCDKDFIAKMLSEADKPFKEYKMKYNEDIEKGILESEVKKYGLDETTSASVIKLTKIGKYKTGVARIIGSLTDEGLKKAKAKGYKNINNVVAYNCEFECSEKGSIIWHSYFPYAN